MSVLLAVDLGLRTGLAWFDRAGRLTAYRSRHFGSLTQLRPAIRSWLTDADAAPSWLVLEGGGPIADAWTSEADRHAIDTVRVAARDWRADLLLPREQRDGRSAKHHADRRARQVIEWSAAPKPTSLRHDAAEAILLGLWATLHLGWLTRLPAELRP